MRGFIKAIGRLLNGLIQHINTDKKKRYSDDFANTIANGERLRKSDSSYSDLADKSRSDSTE